MISIAVLISHKSKEKLGFLFDTLGKIIVSTIRKSSKTIRMNFHKKNRAKWMQNVMFWLRESSYIIFLTTLLGCYFCWYTVIWSRQYPMLYFPREQRTMSSAPYLMGLLRFFFINFDPEALSFTLISSITATYNKNVYADKSFMLCSPVFQFK